MSKLLVMKGGAYTEKRLRKWFKEDRGVVIQTKRDEFRCVVDINWNTESGDPHISYTSAQGKPLHNLNQFDAFWAEVSHRTGFVQFDTGVSVNDSFDLTRRTVRASTKPYDLTGQVEQVIAGKKNSDPAYYTGLLKARFWFYDIPQLGPKSYTERRQCMHDIALNFPEWTACPETEVIVLDEHYALDRAIDVAVQDVNNTYEAARAAGFEGLMVKRYQHTWEPSRRPDSWMKMKPNSEVDGEIIGYTPGRGKYQNMIGSLLCAAEDGSQFSISGMTDAERQEFTDNFQEYRGKWITATYMERGSQGGYRHPKFDRIHDEKNL